jgi:hypothetical protein
LHDVHFSNLPPGAATSQHLVQQPPQYAEATASSLSETSIVPAQLIEIVDNTAPRFQQNLILNLFETVHWNDPFHLMIKTVHSPKESFFTNWRLRKPAIESQAIV